MQTGVGCYIMRSQSNYWYLAKSIFQVAAYYYLYRQTRKIAKNKSIDESILDAIEKAKMHPKDKSKLIRYVSRNRDQMNNRGTPMGKTLLYIERLLLILAALKMISMGRFYARRLSRYQQCMRQQVTPTLRANNSLNTLGR